MHANDLILFTEVVELGTFSKVAEKNNLTNSVVSKRIAKLEEALGVQLLYRTTRKLTLTEAGKLVLQNAKIVKQATLDATASVSDFGDKICGHIKMTVPTISGEHVLADCIAELCNMYPELSVDMNLDNRFIDLLEDGYDLAIRTGYLEDSSLIARHIVDSQWIVVASPEYLENHGWPMQPTDLQQHNCLKYTYQTTGATEWEFKGSNGNYIVKVEGNFATNNAGALHRAALGGRGVVYVPTVLVYKDIQQGRLVDLFPEQVGKKLGIYAVYPYTRQPPRKLQLLIEHIRNKYLSIEHQLAINSD